MKKASHLSGYVKETLRNMENVVGNFVTCMDGCHVGLKYGVNVPAWKRGWTLI